MLSMRVLSVLSQLVLLGAVPNTCYGGLDSCQYLQDDQTKMISEGDDTNALLQGRMEKQQKIQNSLAPKTSATMLLEEVQSMANDTQNASGAPVRDLSKIRLIKTIVVETLMPELTAAHSFMQKEIDDAKQKIDACIFAANSGLESVASMNASASILEGEHAACRKAEKTLLDEMNTRCGAQQSYLDTLKNKMECPPTQAVLGEMYPYLELHYDYFLELKQKKEACENATHAHTGQQASCDTKQATFENGFCSYRTKVFDTSETYTSCKIAATDHYKDVETQAKAEVPKWEAEYTAIQKILCFLDTWLSDDNLDTVALHAPSSCNGSAIDKSAVVVIYPDISDQQPDVTESNLASSHELVSIYPGLAAFPDRYSGLTYNQGVAKCLDFTTTTTTPATTTTTEGVEADPLLPLIYPMHAAKGTFQKCQGDCDADSDCADGMLCFQRQNGEPVPGCLAGGAGDTPTADYCYKAQYILGADNTNNCPSGYAKIQSASACEAAAQALSLQYFGVYSSPPGSHYGGYDVYPGGCGKYIGSIHWQPRTRTYFNEHQGAARSQSYPICEAEPLGGIQLVYPMPGTMKGSYQICQGDCDADSDCADGMLCFQRQNGEPVPGCLAGGAGDTPTADYCYKALATTTTTTPKAQWTTVYKCSVAEGVSMELSPSTIDAQILADARLLRICEYAADGITIVGCATTKPDNLYPLEQLRNGVACVTQNGPPEWQANHWDFFGKSSAGVVLSGYTMEGRKGGVPEGQSSCDSNHIAHAYGMGAGVHLEHKTGHGWSRCAFDSYSKIPGSMRVEIGNA